jgi:hydroxymethylglutaryl-CoA reductase (NADPH)
MQNPFVRGLPRDSRDDHCAAIIEKRRERLQELASCQLDAISSSPIDAALTRGNIENIIGFAQVPLGIVGPLRVAGEHARGDFYIPMATTEGALVASYNRGARVLTLSGGVRVVTVRDMIQRAPYFTLRDIRHAKAFTEWLTAHWSELQAQVAQTTHHGKLEHHTTYLVGRTVYVRLDYSVGDAMGMNMITKATEVVCRYIASHFDVAKWVIESNMAVDKKPAHINMILGRGKSVSAEALIPAALIRRFLGTTASALADNIRGQIVGNTIAGVTGCTYHFANGLAALYLACGQDVANISESAVGLVNFEDDDGDLYVSVYLPSLVVGTVGGGTGLPTQREALELLGCFGTGKACKFAEIAAATLLAGEISLAAAICAGDFVSAHEKYGRNRPEELSAKVP